MKLTEKPNSIKIKAPGRDLMHSIAWKFPLRFFIFVIDTAIDSREIMRYN